MVYFYDLPNDIIILINDIVLEKEPLLIYDLYVINRFFKDNNKSNLHLLPIKYIDKLKSNQKKRLFRKYILDII